VLLIAHTTTYRNRGQWGRRRQHQGLGYLNAPTQHVVSRRCAKRAFESPAKVAGTETNEPRQLFDVNPSRYVSFDVRTDSSRLPRREAAARNARFPVGQ
jgi:hypothetical protein